ncbi:MAG: amino acid adenylation domain-containing protein [Phycisphaerales bacterium]|nr:amino acid adenylation domain-containing protein [Phycisphaerales bacterium]
MIYTSGSTGKPKGVCIAHRALANLLHAMREHTAIAEDDLLLAVTTLSFDMAALELYLPLIAGARLVLASRETAAEGEALSKCFADHSITLMQATPATWRLLIEAGWQGSDKLRVLCGGEALPRELADQLLTRCASVSNLYGPTETTIWSSAERVQANQTISIGRPLANTEIHILDGALNPVPIGVPGELHIGGAGLARGYLNRPELTAEKFIANPFSGDPNARLYKTGDLARYRADGNIEFLGRTDQQVKIRGFRIELAEIEAALAQHPEVKACAVLSREGTPGDKRLIAYLVAKAEAPALSELRGFIQSKLPEYMMPSAFVMLDALPMTLNGKLDRKALPAPSDARPDIGDAFIAPANSLESMLADIYSDVLNIKQIGIHDNFLNLGGHSLLAAQIIARVRQALQIELPVRLLLEGSSVSALAAQIETCELKKYAPLTRVARHGDLPVSFSQERAWFIQQLDPASIAYNFQATLRFTGQLDSAVLERSLSEIVRRHEILRTSFPAVNGRPVQLVHNAELVRVPVVDLQTLPERGREAAAQRIIEMEIRKRFDLAQLPLIRWALIRLAADEHILLQIEHHLLHDGWSFHVFLGELLELYKAFMAGKSSPLPEPPMQFADFAIAQRRWMEDEEGAAQLDYWKTKLSGAEALTWRSDRPRPAQQTFVGTAPRVELSLDLCEALRTLSRRAGVTLFMTMFTAFLIVLQRYTAQNDICVGSGIANRRWRETESMLGMILNNVVLRVDLSGDPDFRELLRRVQQVTLAAYANQDVPFDQVVRALDQTRDPSRNPLFQVMFSFHELADALIRYKITTLWLTASLFHLMVDHHLEALRGLRQLLAGGDVLSVAHLKKFLAAQTGCRLINGYGPTENTTFTCCYSIPHDAKIISSVPIGRPIANTQVYILDRHLNPVSIGVPGELHIGGAGLARGYLNRPELTQEKFIPNLFSEDPEARLYKTGDLACYLPDGNIEFLGRTGHQVKVRGFRIELGEIEAVLVQHPDVREAAVIAREDTPNDKRLIAYIVPGEIPPGSRLSQRGDGEDLRSYLKTKLPEYMLPSAFVVMNALPLTPNAKLDRKALPAPEYRSEESFVAPRTPTEDRLAAIWGEVLKLDRVGIHDNFFDLGGHSLLATQVIARLRKTFSVDVQLRALFESPTVVGLSALIVQSQAKALGEDELAQLLTEAEEHGEQPERTLDRGRK